MPTSHHCKHSLCRSCPLAKSAYEQEHRAHLQLGAVVLVVHQREILCRVVTVCNAQNVLIPLIDPHNLHAYSVVIFPTGWVQRVRRDFGEMPADCHTGEVSVSWSSLVLRLQVCESRKGLLSHKQCEIVTELTHGHGHGYCLCCSPE